VTPPLPKPRWFQFSLAWLLRTVAVYALACGIFLALPRFQLITALIILTVFVSVDWALIQPVQFDVPRMASEGRIFSFYATAFAVAVAGCLIAFLCRLPLGISNTGATGLKAVFEPVVRTGFLTFLYVVGFSFFSAIAFLASLFALHHYRTAWWLLAVNSPGFLLFCFSVIIIIGAVLTGDLTIENP
jgi:hypothetical protein